MCWKKSRFLVRAVRFEGVGQLTVADMPEPAPGPGQVLLRVTVAGLCQTDVHIVQGHFPVRPPRVLGHEFSGEVAAIGPGVKNLAVGQPVGVSPAIFCGECAYCRRGQPQQCQRFRCLGNTEDGGWAEFALIRADQAIPLGDLRPEQAVWLEPLSCVVRALGFYPNLEGAAAMVIGAGPLGLLALQALRTYGAGPVAVVDPNPGKIERASHLGADCAQVVERTGETSIVDAALGAVAPLGFDLTIDTTGKSVSIARALRWTGRTGTVILFGVFDPEDRLLVSPAEIFDKELTIRAAAGSTPDAFAEAVRLMQTERFDTGSLVWRKVGMDDVPQVVAALMQPGEKGKVLVYPGR
jgi:threonine dehydrogenase-like Zn-dependent dehydrogenase